MTHTNHHNSPVITRITTASLLLLLRDCLLFISALYSCTIHVLQVNTQHSLREICLPFVSPFISLLPPLAIPPFALPCGLSRKEGRELERGFAVPRARTPRQISRTPVCPELAFPAHRSQRPVENSVGSPPASLLLLLLHSHCLPQVVPPGPSLPRQHGLGHPVHYCLLFALALVLGRWRAYLLAYWLAHAPPPVLWVLPL